MSASRGAQAGYLKWLLVGNPFAQLSSEGLDEVSPFHVETDLDRELREIVVKALEKEEKAVVVLVGEFGSGKTQRLRFLAEQINWAERIYVKIDSDDWADVARSIVGAIRSGILDKILLRRAEEGLSDPVRVAKEVALELNRRDRVLLMLDEIENVLMGTRKDAVAFARFLRELHQRLEGGKVILIACVPDAIRAIGSFLERLGARILRVGPVSPEAAQEIIKRRMAHYRVEDRTPINPYYPFTERVVRLIAEKAGYNPRSMIRIARSLLSHVTVGEGGKVAIDEARMLEVLGGGREPARVAGRGPPTPRELVELYRRRGPFTLREAASALEVGVVEALTIMRELERSGIVRRDRSGRYIVTERSPRPG